MNMKEKIQRLINLGAGNIDHLSGSLINHLKGTYDLLKSWDADPELCLAGLYHAVYGTSAFDEILMSKGHRDKVREIVCENTEKIVYIYCACDRDFFWPQIGINDTPIFRDRFTNEEYRLSLEELKCFCELTVANEVEIGKNSPEFIQKNAASLCELFQRMKPYISKEAQQASTLFDR